MTMTLYVNAKSKKALNETLSAGEKVIGTNYSIFGGGGQYVLGPDLEVGTVIKIYEKMSMGQPYAKSYGTWDGKKVK